MRAIENGAELHLTCRACGEPAVLTIAETAQPGGDELASTVTATIRTRRQRTGHTAKEAMLDRLDEALAHTHATVKLTESEAFLEGRIYARATASTLGCLHAISGSMARSLAEHLAATRKAIEEFSVPLDG